MLLTFIAHQSLCVQKKQWCVMVFGPACSCSCEQTFFFHYPDNMYVWTGHTFLTLSEFCGWMVIREPLNLQHRTTIFYPQSKAIQFFLLGHCWLDQRQTCMLSAVIVSCTEWGKYSYDLSMELPHKVSLDYIRNLSTEHCLKHFLLKALPP